jgi:hypothetical protein
MARLLTVDRHGAALRLTAKCTLSAYWRGGYGVWHSPGRCYECGMLAVWIGWFTLEVEM